MSFSLIVFFNKERTDYLIYGPYTTYESAVQEYARLNDYFGNHLVAHDIVKLMTTALTKYIR